MPGTIIRQSRIVGVPSSLERSDKSQSLSFCPARAFPDLAFRGRTFSSRSLTVIERYSRRQGRSNLASDRTQPRMSASRDGKKARPASVRVLTWNIDMNTPSWAERTKAQAEIVNKMDPPVDIFMVQEVTCVSHMTGSQSVLAMLRAALSSFELHVDPKWAGTKPYFVALFSRRGVFRKSPAAETSFTDFAGSAMDRSCLTVEGSLASNGKRVAFVTSHFESEKAGVVQRKAQFDFVVAEMRERARNGIITVFGGDTNLREGEISGVTVAKKVDAERKERGADPNREDDRRRVADAYIQAGADPNEKFTWDCEKNDNLQADWDFKPRSRYDRVFLFGPVLQFPSCTKWKLVGKERLPCGSFPSDHWGVCVDIAIPADASEPNAVAKKSSSDGEVFAVTGTDGAEKPGAAASKRAPSGKSKSESTKRRKIRS